MLKLIAIGLIVIAALYLVFAWQARGISKTNSRDVADYPYCKANAFLSKAEASFFGVLRQAVGEDGIVFTKVRIGDVLAVTPGLDRSERQRAFNKISAKHFDFVICTKDTVQPIAAVELDDASHNKPAQKKRDAFVEGATQAAGLPLLRIPAKHSYSVAQIKEHLITYLEPRNDASRNDSRGTTSLSA